MNKIILMGRLTTEPDVRYSRGVNSTAIARYNIAVDRKHKKGEDNAADFFRVVAFGKAAEFAEKYLQKGMRVIISGRVETGSYENRDGVKVPSFEVIAEEQEFAENKVAAVTSIAENIRPSSAPEETQEDEEYMDVSNNDDDDYSLPFN